MLFQVVFPVVHRPSMRNACPLLVRAVVPWANNVLHSDDAAAPFCGDVGTVARDKGRRKSLRIRGPILRMDLHCGGGKCVKKCFFFVQQLYSNFLFPLQYAVVFTLQTFLTILLCRDHATHDLDGSMPTNTVTTVSANQPLQIINYVNIFLLLLTVLGDFYLYWKNKQEKVGEQTIQ